MLSPNPSKRAVERYWLLYTPVWGGISAVVMLGGFAESWGDVGCMLYGVVLFLGAALPPLLRPHEADRARPFVDRTSTKMVLSVTLLAFGLNYTQTPFFYDVLHMHYGFNTTWNIANNPFFLYLVSVAYFATYAVLTCVAYRWMKPRAGALANIAAPMGCAFLETALNANPFMERLFCYDEMAFMLWFGTLAYGLAFVFALPMWMGIDEQDATGSMSTSAAATGSTVGHRTTLGLVAVWCGAALYADLIALDLLRFHVAPQFTTVVPDANGLRDFATSCLVSPTPP